MFLDYLYLKKNHIMFRGQKENVKRALSSIAESYSKADRKASSRRKSIVTSLIPEAVKFEDNTILLVYKYLDELRRYYGGPNGEWTVFSWFKDYVPEDVTILSDITSNGSIRSCTGIDDHISLDIDRINLSQSEVTSKKDQESASDPAHSTAQEEHEESQFFMDSQDFQSRINAFKDVFKTIQPELIVKHPLVFPDDFGKYKSKDSFGSPTARPIIIDGSNVAFGNGAFDRYNMRYTVNDEYGFEQGTAKYNPMGIKVVMEELWANGAFYYSGDTKIDIVVTLTISRKHGHLVDENEQVILRQLELLGKLIGHEFFYVIEKWEDEDLTIIDFSIQKNSAIVTNDKFNNRQAFTINPHSKNYRDQDISKCRKRILEHFFTAGTHVKLRPRDSRVSLDDLLFGQIDKTSLQQQYENKCKMNTKRRT